MEMFLESFKPFEKRLKSRDLTLLAEESCVFLHHLEINRIWTPSLDPALQEHIWRYLIGGYMIVEILVRVPEHIMAEIETMMRTHYQTVLKDEFDKVGFRAAAESILINIEDKNVEELTSYMWEWVISDDTPIYHLIPPQYHELAKQVFDACKTPEGRKLFLDQLSPVIEDIKGRVGDTTLDYDFLDGGEGDEGDEEERKERKPRLSKAEERKEKHRIISHVLDVMTEAISRNKDSLKNIMSKPVETIQALFANTIIPSLTAAKIVRVDPEEFKRQRDKENEDLFGTPSSSASASRPARPARAATTTPSSASASPATPPTARREAKMPPAEERKAPPPKRSRRQHDSDSDDDDAGY